VKKESLNGIYVHSQTKVCSAIRKVNDLNDKREGAAQYVDSNSRGRKKRVRRYGVKDTN